MDKYIIFTISLGEHRISQPSTALFEEQKNQRRRIRFKPLDPTNLRIDIYIGINICSEKKTKTGFNQAGNHQVNHCHMCFFLWPRTWEKDSRAKWIMTKVEFFLFGRKTDEGFQTRSHQVLPWFCQRTFHGSHEEVMITINFDQMMCIYHISYYMMYYIYIYTLGSNVMFIVCVVSGLVLVS